jgi:hypothetical protein
MCVLNLFFENWQIKMYDLIIYIQHIILKYIFIGKWLILVNWHMYYLIQLPFFVIRTLYSYCLIIFHEYNNYIVNYSHHVMQLTSWTYSSCLTKILYLLLTHLSKSFSTRPCQPPSHPIINILLPCAKGLNMDFKYEWDNAALSFCAWLISL